MYKIINTILYLSFFGPVNFCKAINILFVKHSIYVKSKV